MSRPFHDLAERGQCLDPNSGTARLSVLQREFAERWAKIMAAEPTDTRKAA